MIPPLSTRSLQTAIEAKRRAEAAAGWAAAFRPTRYETVARRDIPVAAPLRP